MGCLVSPLLSPLRYLSIRHGWWLRYNVICPLLGGFAVGAIIYATPNTNPIFGTDGLLKSLEPTLAIIGGFFVAALTLVTSEKTEVLKAPVGGESPPSLNGEVLSRRRFLAYLFGYLAFSSFALIGISVLAGLLKPLVASFHLEAWEKIASTLAATFAGAWLTHIIVATLLGLYYFTERLQVSDRRLNFGSRPDNPPHGEA